ncbi:DUF4349 domain-containing protein [Actinokineospora pegani]|uniref:DUF4349 domain-containing protein n=1 Tax=Actinokineospora pegani TaxID=2654637 RepID=UPI0018D431F4|nr:DUF4349 domain-containing protein [Actinokineospora pegani]
MDSTTSRRARRTAGLLVSLTAMVAVASCSADMSGSGAAPAAVAPDAGVAAPEGARGGGGTGREQARQQEQVAAPGVDRKLVRRADLTLASDDVGEAADRVRSEVLAVGGFSGDEKITERVATMTLRVPADKLDAVLGRITGGEIGEVRSRGQSAEDVTEQSVDLESRIKTQQASVERVRALLADASSVGDVVQIEGEVTRREAELESLLARRDALAGSVALSTVSVRVERTDAVTAPEEPDEPGFLDALAVGWDSLVFGGSVLLRIVGFVLPFAVPVALVWWLARRLRKRFKPTPAPAAQD